MEAGDFNQLFYDVWDEVGQPEAPVVVIDQNSGKTFQIKEVRVEQHPDDGSCTVWIGVDEN